MKKLLIITGKESAGNSVGSLAEFKGYEILRANCGMNGIEMAKSEKPNLVICDISLPDIDGYCVSNMINKNAIRENVPVLLLNLGTQSKTTINGKDKSDLFIPAVRDAESFISAIKKDCIPDKNKEHSHNLNSLLQLLSSESPDKAPEPIISGYRTRHFDKRENIYFEGEIPNMVYLVRKGKVKTVKPGPEGKEFIVGIHEKGELFGYIAVLEDSTYPDTAVTAEESDILLIPKDDFKFLINSDHQLGRHFIKLLANDISDIEERLMTLAYNSVRARVAGALLQLKKKHHPKIDSETYTIHVTRDDLAGLIGTTTESLIRTLSDFKHENIVDTEVGEIKILDSKSLEKIRRIP